MKKITFVIADLGAGGAQRVIASLANEFARQPGYHVNVVSLSAPCDGSFFDFPPDVKIHYAAINGSSGNIFSRIFSNLRRLLSLRVIVRDLCPDVVISFLIETNCMVLLATMGLSVPVIVSERSDPYVYPEKPLWRALRRVVYPMASHLVCQTQYAADYFHYISCKSVIYNPVRVSETIGLQPCDGPYILGVGRQSEEKGFDTLIRAHALLLGDMPDLKLLLIGDGPQRTYLERLAGELGSASQVVFAGAQSDISGYYTYSLAFVLPSRFEGMPNALLEAMAYGCAVVSTASFSAAPEIIDHGKDGLIASGDDAQALAVEIKKLYEDPDLRNKLKAGALEGASRYNPQIILRQWFSLLSSGKLSS